MKCLIATVLQLLLKQIIATGCLVQQVSEERWEGRKDISKHTLKISVLWPTESENIGCAEGSRIPLQSLKRLWIQNKSAVQGKGEDVPFCLCLCVLCFQLVIFCNFKEDVRFLRPQRSRSVWVCKKWLRYQFITSNFQHLWEWLKKTPQDSSTLKKSDLGTVRSMGGYAASLSRDCVFAEPCSSSSVFSLFIAIAPSVGSAYEWRVVLSKLQHSSCICTRRMA